MIRIQGVTKRFRRIAAIDSVSLHVPAGDSVALWGDNGAGKTTLIRCVLGLLQFTGRIHIGDYDVHRQGKFARMLVGYVPQEIGFYDDLRVSDALHFFARLRNLGQLSAANVLGGVGLDGHGRKRIRELSGGMKQRLALAIAMLGDPPVLVLDEVTTSLDACGREEFVALLSRLCGTGRTLLFASHRVEEVASLAKRVVVLNKGRFAAEHPIAEFTAQWRGAAVLHLSLGAPHREPAIRHLAAHGYHPSRNGAGIWVPVAANNRAAPLQLLSDAKIPVENFDLVAPATAPALLAAEQETRHG
jgi:ABC-type multidrug transport system ATPase subunit